MKKDELKVQYGELVTGDLGANTMVFCIEGDMVLQAGKYAIVPIKQYLSTQQNADLKAEIQKDAVLKIAILEENEKLKERINELEKKP